MKAGEANRSRLRPALFVLETGGLAVLVYLWLPMYRRLLSGPGGDHPASGILGRALLCVVVIQASYWVRRRLPARPPSGPHVLAGHLLLFLSRLTFVIAGSFFTIIVLRSGDTRGSWLGMTIMLIGLFSIFCYVMDLERMGRARMDPPEGFSATGPELPGRDAARRHELPRQRGPRRR